MNKNFYSLGLMSGTSMDGIDASIIQSDGDIDYKVIMDKYFEYSKDIYQDLYELRDKINNFNDLKKLSKEAEVLEKRITLLHAKAANEIINDSKINVDLIGFHGQTIFHNTKKSLRSDERISKQLGDGKLLAQLTKKTVVNNFRQNDILNGGEGAPLTPIFHKLLTNQHKINLPTTILNIGGIANFTYINKKNEISSADIGPGNCLIDQWIKKNSKKNFDLDGKIAESGKVNKVILDQAINNWHKKFSVNFNSKKSYDIKDFDLSFVHGLSLEDGAATLTEYTSKILSEYLGHITDTKKIIVCGGGRKNNFLMKNISKNFNHDLNKIDQFGINGDFIESQAFAFLAIRSYLNLPISFPETTGVKKPSTGGSIFKIKL